MRRMLNSRKAVSPVIATIIIVAIAISIAIAVAYWMVGITGAFTRFEKLELVSGYATWVDDHYEVKLKVKNTGTTDATINMVFINGKPSSDVDATINPALDISLKVADERDVTVELPAEGFNAGQSVEVTLHTASGKDYPKNVVLP